jgi:hypothetical protein
MNALFFTSKGFRFQLDLTCPIMLAFTLRRLFDEYPAGRVDVKVQAGLPVTGKQLQLVGGRHGVHDREIADWLLRMSDYIMGAA